TGRKFVPDFPMAVNILKRILVRLQVIANDVGMTFCELLVCRHRDVRRCASALMGFVLGAQIRNYAVSVLSESLNGFHCSKQRRINISFAQQFDEGWRRRCDEFGIMKEVYAVPVLCEDRKKRKRR